MLFFKKLRSLVLCLGMLMVLPFSTQGKEPHSIDEKALIEIKNVILEAYDDKFREDTLLNTLSYLFNIIDTNKDGVTSEEIQFAIQRKMAKKRAALLNQVLLHDMNGDWNVSRNEVENYFNSSRGLNGAGNIKAEQKHVKRMRKRFVDRVMNSDPNNDGVITPTEYKNLKNTQSVSSTFGLHERIPQIAKVLLKNDPNQDGRVTQIESFSLISQAFQNYKSNKKAEAITRLKDRVKDYIPFKGHTVCNVRKPSSNSKLVVYGNYGGSTIPTVTVAEQDKETNLAFVNIEKGQDKLFLVMTSYKSLIWKFTGDVDRIEHIVLSGPSSERRMGDVAVGSIGLEKTKISYVSKKCFYYFYKTTGAKADRVKLKMKSLFGKKPDYLFGNYSTYQLSLPSGKHKKARRSRLVELNKNFDRPSHQLKNTQRAFLELEKSNGDKNAIRAMKRFFPGGVKIIDPTQVVSNSKAETYEVLPNQAGIAQLLLEGRLKAGSKRNTYFIVKPIRYPPSMGGAHSVKFYLKKGVPEPTGDPIHSCVYSEEKGQNIEGVCM